MNFSGHMIGKLAEVRIVKEQAVRDRMTVGQQRQAETFVAAIAGRSGGSFHMVVGSSRMYCERMIAAELLELLGYNYDPSVAQFLQFRVNFNDLDAAGRTWESFSVGDFSWHDLGVYARATAPLTR